MCVCGTDPVGVMAKMMLCRWDDITKSLFPSPSDRQELQQCNYAVVFVGRLATDDDIGGVMTPVSDTAHDDCDAVDGNADQPRAVVTVMCQIAWHVLSPWEAIFQSISSVGDFHFTEDVLCFSAEADWQASIKVFSQAIASNDGPERQWSCRYFRLRSNNKPTHRGPRTMVADAVNFPTRDMDSVFPFWYTRASEEDMRKFIE